MIHTNKQLFAFNMPIKSLLKKVSKYHVHLFAKTLNNKILLANELQAKFFANTSPDKFVGDNYRKYITQAEAQNYLINDRIAINNSIPHLAYEQALNKGCLSIKTQLRDSANNAIGIGGLAFYFHQITLQKSLVLVNEIFAYTALLNKMKYGHVINNMNFNHLSPREKECAYLLTRGMTYREIGDKLKISHRTVMTHIEHIKNKLDCYNKSAIVSKIFEDLPLTQPPIFS